MQRCYFVPKVRRMQWHKQPNGPDYDGVEISRRGDMNVNARIILDPDYNPQKCKLSPMLADLLDMKLETKPQIVMALWNYIKARIRHWKSKMVWT